MMKKLLLLAVFMAIEAKSVVKTTKIADFIYQLNTNKSHTKTFINKTGKKIWFRYKLVNHRNGHFVAQEPVMWPGDVIDIDFSKLGKQILPAGYGRVMMSYEVAKVTQTPEKKMDELCACRFRNGKKDLQINKDEFDRYDQFELHVDSKGRIECKFVEIVE